jgi:hypothetical protein
VNFFRRTLCLAAALVLALLLSVPAMAAVTDQYRTATPTASNIIVNGKTVKFTAYTIDGSNYFRLRDIAMAFNGTVKNFSVGYDTYEKKITIVTGSPYTPIGGELTGDQATESVQALPSAASISINGWKTVLMAYTINSSTYFRLRDLASTLNFGLSWDGVNNTVTISTLTGYDANDNQRSGGAVAEIIGSWSGNYLNGKRSTVYFRWDGTFTEGYGDPATGDYKQTGSGSFTTNGVKLTIVEDAGNRAEYIYALSLMDGRVALALTNNGITTTLFKN